MTICQLYEDLLHRHRTAIALYADDTLELAAAHQRAADDAWQRAYEHHKVCPVCRETQQPDLKIGQGGPQTAAWLRGANRSRALAAMKRLDWVGYD